MMTITVPGNILLMGEYAILEEGYQGIALAADRYVRISSESGNALCIHGILGVGRCCSWDACQPETQDPFLTGIVSVCQEYIQHQGLRSDVITGVIHIDSSDFFSSTQKLGLGSSAAVCVGLTFALLFLALGPQENLVSITHLVATEAHARAQGRPTSGYDIATSLFGGMGVFTGGANPSWLPLELPWSLSLGLLHAEKAVSTPKAVNNYVAWKAAHPKHAQKFLDLSQRCIAAFAHATRWSEAARAIRTYRRLGIWIGQQFGYEAEPPELKRHIQRCHAQGYCAKAVGAGGELGLCVHPETFSENNPENLSLTSVTIAPKGLQWSV